jgi:hypothetical protein
MIATWLDEEWTPLEVHTELGKAAGAAYVTCRQQGDDDMSSLVLGLSNELLAFNYRETFVNAFEVCWGQAAAVAGIQGSLGSSTDTQAKQALPTLDCHGSCQQLTDTHAHTEQ